MKQGFGKLASLKEAIEIMNSLVREKDNESIKLDNSLNRVLAGEVTAKIDVPHFRRAAMDGFAVRAETTFGASNANPKELDKEDCIEIVTGALLPENMDSVLMVEYTEKYDKKIRICKAVTPGENVINIGSDIKKGNLLLKKGTVLSPRFIGVLASQGMKEILVKKKPVIAYFSTGNEILNLNERLEQGKVYDINSFTIKNSIVNENCEVIDLGIAKDDKEEIKNKILEGIGKADFLLLSGGSSLGEKDFMLEAVKELGEVLVHGIAVKPGKPVLIGKVKGKLVVGLPGYPTSALSNFYILVLQLIDKMLERKREIKTVKARLSKKIVSTVGRYEFLAVKLDNNIAIPIQKGSSAITTLTEADGFIEIDENTEVLEKDSLVEVRLF